MQIHYLSEGTARLSRTRDAGGGGRGEEGCRRRQARAQQKPVASGAWKRDADGIGHRLKGGMRRQARGSGRPAELGRGDGGSERRGGENCGIEASHLGEGDGEGAEGEKKTEWGEEEKGEKMK